MAWIQDAIDDLHNTQEVEVSVESLGYRSAFAGAVLLTLPNAVLVRSSPPRIRLGLGLTSQHGRSAPQESHSPDHPGEPSQLDGATNTEALAAVLRGYRDRWVAVQRNQVLTDQDSFSDVVAWLRGNGIKADSVFLVPDDPERLLAGLAN